LKGEKITVINADKVVVTGNPKFNKRILLERRTRGSPQHGPFYPRSPEAMLWRAVRGMLPYKKSHGREALARLQVKAGDAGLKGEPVTRAVRSDFAYLGDLAKEIGWDGL
jgi:large subunit ribosomal protein L13